MILRVLGKILSLKVYKIIDLSQSAIGIFLRNDLKLVSLHSSLICHHSLESVLLLLSRLKLIVLYFSPSGFGLSKIFKYKPKPPKINRQTCILLILKHQLRDRFRRPTISNLQKFRQNLL